MSEKKANERDEGRRKSSVDRRLFLQGMGLTTAATALGGFTQTPVHATGAESTPKANGSATLKNAPVVMVWRRISSLYEAQSFVNKTLGLPVVGQDPTSIMYDAGGMLLGFAVHEVPASGDALAEVCSEPGLQSYNLQNNPASSLLFAPSDFQSSIQKLYLTRGMITSPSRSEAGEKLVFLDDDGNFSCFYKPSSAALSGIDGAKLNALLRNRRAAESTDVKFDEERKTGPQKIPNPVVGIELLVSDLSKSKKFYADVLGLQLLSSGTNEAKFDVGPVILTLRLEPTSMLVQFLKKTGRLMGDWFVFHVEDIKASTKSLVQQGIKFPAGIETSIIGDVAYFNDPDGYSLVLWQPSGKTKMINFKPVLERLLKESGNAVL